MDEHPKAISNVVEEAERLLRKRIIVPYEYDVTRIKPPSFVIQGFMPTGVSIIAGEPGVGKTSALVPLFCAVLLI